MKVYLAGPEVFQPNAIGLAQERRAMLASKGFKALIPLDSDVPGELDKAHAFKIYSKNVDMIYEADALICNLTPFRGISADPGTVFELGLASGFGKFVFAFSSDISKYAERVHDERHCLDGNSIEPFGLRDNLMLEGALAGQCNPLYNSFDEALDALVRFRG